MKAVNVVLAIALGVVSLVGLGRGATAWLGWLDVCVAVLSLLVALLPARTTEELRNPDAGIGLALLSLWAIGWSAGATASTVWWTFAFGSAYWVVEATKALKGPALGRPSHA